MLLLIGGSYWVGDQKHWTNLVQAFDPGLNAWIEKPSLPIALSDAALAVFRKEIYILGGGSGLTISTHIFVLRDGHWRESEGAPLPEPRLYATAVSSGDYIYLVGGMSRVRDYTTVSNSFWRWRPGSKQWQILAPLPGPGRINQAMTEINGIIYVFGGATTGSTNVENVRDAFKYDTKSQTWTRLPDLPVANRSWSAVRVGTHALLLGGYTNELVRDVYIFNPQQNQLRPATPLPYAVADIKFVRIGDLLVGSGGELDGHDRNRKTMLAVIPKIWFTKDEQMATNP
jgi:N-acetylneuraminic acid mutarotase